MEWIDRLLIIINSSSSNSKSNEKDQMKRDPIKELTSFLISEPIQDWFPALLVRLGKRRALVIDTTQTRISVNVSKQRSNILVSIQRGPVHSCSRQLHQRHRERPVKERKKYKTKQKRAFQFSFCVIKTEYFSFNNQFGVKSSYNFFDRAIERERERERERRFCFGGN